MRYYPFGLRQLVSFAEIARLSSYRMAAESLRIAQPALTRQIQNLEEATPRQAAVAFVSCGIGITTLTESLRYLVTEGTVYRRLIRPTPRISSYLVARRDEARGTPISASLPPSSQNR